MLDYYKRKDAHATDRADQEEEPDLTKCHFGRVQVVRRAGTTLGLYATNFFHWITNALPKAVALQSISHDNASSAKDTNEGSLFVLTVDRPFALSALHALGL